METFFLGLLEYHYFQPPNDGSVYLKYKRAIQYIHLKCLVHTIKTGRRQQAWVEANDCTYSEHCCVELSWLAIVEVKLEKMLHLPVRKQQTVWAEQNTVGAIDIAHPDRQLGGFQHTAHLRKKESTQHGCVQNIIDYSAVIQKLRSQVGVDTATHFK